MMSVQQGLYAQESADVGGGQTTKTVAFAVKVSPVEKGREIVIVIMNVRAPLHVGLKTVQMAKRALTVAQPSKFNSFLNYEMKKIINLGTSTLT